MNYYEELGVSAQATEQEIRKAHRRLVKLMHPDAQPDPQLKVMAETQMRRLNSIVSTLLDPAQRMDYDRQLASENAAPLNSAGQALWNGIPWWLASAVGAVVLTLAAIWLWADHLGNGFGGKTNNTVYISPVDGHPAGPPAVNADVKSRAKNGDAPQAATSVSDPSRMGGISATVVSDPPAAPIIVPAKQQPSVPAHIEARPPPVKVNPKPLGDAKSVSTVKAQHHLDEAKSKIKLAVVPKTPDEVPHSRMTTVSRVNPNLNGTQNQQPAISAHKPFALPAGSLMAAATPVRSGKGSPLPLPPGVATQATAHDYNSAMPSAALPAAAPPPAEAEVVTSGASAVKDPLEGEWVYAPKEPERRRAGFYAPEFIDLKLFGSGDFGNLKGRYSAKYLVTDKPVAPEVSFELATVTKGSRKFIWQSANGARGTLNIDPIDERTIRVDWHTTTSIRGPALTSGQATLVRRQ